MGTAAVAAIILRKERRAVEAFARGGATSPAAAQSLEALGIPDGLAVQRLRDHAVLREGAPGLYFVDLEVWHAVRRARRRILLVLAIVVLAAALALGGLRPSHRFPYTTLFRSPNKRLKLAGVYRFYGSRVLCPWRAT